LLDAIENGERRRDASSSPLSAPVAGD